MIQNTQTEDRADFAAAWREPAVEAPDEFEAEAQKRTLADQLEAGEGEKLAAVDAMPMTEHEAYKKATGVSIDGKGDPVQEPAPNNNPGKNDAMTLDWKARNKARQDDDFIKLRMKGGVTREQAEKELKAR